MFLKVKNMVDETSYLKEIVAISGTLITGMATWAWTHTHKRIDDLSDHIEEHMITKDTFNAHTEDNQQRFMQLTAESNTSRAITAKIFDQMRDMEKTTHSNHADILTAISQISRSEK